MFDKFDKLPLRVTTMKRTLKYAFKKKKNFSPGHHSNYCYDIKYLKCVTRFALGTGTGNTKGVFRLTS